MLEGTAFRTQVISLHQTPLCNAGIFHLYLSIKRCSKRLFVHTKDMRNYCYFLWKYLVVLAFRSSSFFPLVLHSIFQIIQLWDEQVHAILGLMVELKGSQWTRQHLAGGLSITGFLRAWFLGQFSLMFS